jgi:MFS family permease
MPAGIFARSRARPRPTKNSVYPYILGHFAHPPLRKLAKVKLSLTELKRLGLAYWLVIVVATVFALARFSEAFLVLRALAAGLPAMLVPAVMVVMSLVYALAAYPAGVLSDKGSRLQVLVIGLLLLMAADVVMAFAPGIPAVATGVALWGLHMGFTQGLLAALVADTAQTELRGNSGISGREGIVLSVARRHKQATAPSMLSGIGRRSVLQDSAIAWSMSIHG